MYMLTNSYYFNLKCPKVEGTIIILPYFRRRGKKAQNCPPFFSLNRSLKPKGFLYFLKSLSGKNHPIYPSHIFPNLEQIHWCYAREEHRTKHQTKVCLCKRILEKLPRHEVSELREITWNVCL